METRDRIAFVALVVSIIAVVVALGSAAFTGKQYFLNVARDEREQAARLPTFDHKLEKVRESRVWKITTTITNRADAKLIFDFVAIEELQGARLALPDGGGGYLNPVGSLKPFVADGVGPHLAESWNGFIVIPDDFPGGRGKPVSLVYAFRLIDRPDDQVEKQYTLILP
jgi:hypothetical protein